MATVPTPRPPSVPDLRLVRFHLAWSETLVSWIGSAREAYWFAPRTAPPITPAHVCHWGQPDREQFGLLSAPRGELIGYGELNRFASRVRSYWLGHLIVAPAWRGRGCGTALTRLLLAEAFEQRGARQVSLVAFPENHAALACYRAAGMREEGYEWHTFPAYGTRACLVRFLASGL